MNNAMIDKNYDFDLFVIGTGPGGEGAAMQATKGGHRVAVAESYSQIGGSCTHRGTIPSKALRYTVSNTVKFLTNPMVQAMGIHFSPSLDQLRKGSQAIINRQVTMRQSFYDRNNVPIFTGTASFVDDHTVSVDGELYTSSHFVLAPGTRPASSTAIRSLTSRSGRHRSRSMARE
jgi:NAD(P) transhydrogenase